MQPYRLIFAPNRGSASLSPYCGLAGRWWLDVETVLSFDWFFRGWFGGIDIVVRAADNPCSDNGPG